MSNILDSEGYGLKIYNRLPEMYRADDVETKYTLLRFLNTCGEGGFKYIIEGANGLLDLYDPDKVDIDILPYLFESYGFTVFNGLPEIYLRNLLPLLSTLFSKKGTLDVIGYLTSIVSGMTSSIEIEPSEHGGIHINLSFEVDSDIPAEDLPDEQQLKRIIGEFLPFYCDMTVVYIITYEDTAEFRVSDSHYDKIYVNYDTNNTFGHAIFGNSVFGSLESAMYNAIDESDM